MIRGLENVGIYVPGGTAAYPSSVLMNAIPARVAEVNKIVMVTPPGKDGKINPNILVAANIAGVDKIYKVGGAQAIAALAFGTETIDKVDKIVGPGNIFVATAKRLVYGKVDIDMIEGPSEITIVSDETANPKYLAADLMSQAEHDVLASSMLITTSLTVAEKVKEELKIQIEDLKRKDIIESSLENYGGIIVVDNVMEAIKMANIIAPEHLELMIKDPMTYVGYVKNAGSIFLGENSPEPIGDYIAGPNHVLPTSGTARFFSPLSVDSFIKKSSYLYYTKEGLNEVGKKAICIANIEGLTAHANSIRVRLED
jgi:histidinol dehydrogenase